MERVPSQTFTGEEALSWLESFLIHCWPARGRLWQHDSTDSMRCSFGLALCCWMPNVLDDDASMCMHLIPHTLQKNVSKLLYSMLLPS